MEKFYKFAQLDTETILKELNTSTDGLSEIEAKKRIEEFGLNRIKKIDIEVFEILKRNFFNYFNILLFFAGILSFVISGLNIETILIFIFFFIALTIAFIQDYRANKLVEKLLEYFKSYIKVKRDGEFKIIDSVYLVPGDYVRIEVGNLIPADVRIIKTENLLIDESVLTGESEPVSKMTDKLQNVKNIYEAKNIGFNGTIVSQGFLEGIIFATGEESYLGKISKTTIDIYKETAYQKEINKFSKFIIYIALFLTSLIIILNFFKPQPLNFKDVILFSIVLIISIIPEFLPGITVLTLSLSAFKLAKRGLIIKRLSAIEDLGGIQVLCVDKTGTITKNVLKVKQILSRDKDKLIKYALADFILAKDTSPYSIALLENVDIEKIKSQFKNTILIEDLPFDPVKRVKSTIISENEECLKIIKGAPEYIISNIKNQEEKEKYLKDFNNLSKRGLRTIAVGIEKEFFEYLGIIGFEDPLKETSYEAINKAKKLGVKIKILTGDAKDVAKYIGIKLGLCKENDEIFTGEDIKKLTDEKLKDILEENNVFARVLPEDKFKIIKILQEKYFVGFLGEGINDAPALKIADVSLAVDNATDIIKQEADIILREKDLNLIVSAIYEGRKDFYNLGKYLKHTMSDNLGNMFAISLLTLFLKYLPLLPIQVLLTNLITDLPVGPIGIDNVRDDDIKKPITISSYSFVFLLIILGMIAGFINITAFLLVKNLDPSSIRTAIFLITTFTGIFVMFSIRTKQFFIHAPKIPLILFLMLILSILLTILFTIHPFFIKIFNFSYLPIKIYINILILLILFIIFTEIGKRIIYKFYPDTI